MGDDKGSVVVCLHALKAIKDSGVKLKRRVRIIVGADEERGSSCIRTYLARGGEVPVMSFVPDSEFPVINSPAAFISAASKRLPLTIFISDLSGTAL